MTKATLQAMESLWEWEISSSFEDAIPPRIRPPRLAKAMIDAGLILDAEATLPGRFPVKIKAHVLTYTGRLVYCEWAAEQPEHAW